MKKETSNADLEFRDQIVFVRIKDGAEITTETMEEQWSVQKEMVGRGTYAVLVDGKKNYTLYPEVREYMAAYQPQGRVATALVANKNLATLMIANFYLRFNRPKVPTRMFKEEEEAVLWLKEKLEKHK